MKGWTVSAILSSPHHLIPHCLYPRLSPGTPYFLTSYPRHLSLAPSVPPLTPFFPQLYQSRAGNAINILQISKPIENGFLVIYNQAGFPGFLS